MRNSEFVRAVIVLLGGAGLAGCGSYGDPCLRTTDCNAGFICSEGRCIIDLSDSPSDASSTPSDGASTPSDGTSPGVDGKVSTDTSTPDDTDASDAAGPDAKNDAAADALRDVGNGTGADAADARVSSDSITSEGGGGDVGAPRDSGADGDAAGAKG